MAKRERPQAVSLFSGAGGLDIGLERAGWDLVAATDFDNEAVETLRSTASARIPIPGQGRSYLESTKIIHADVKDVSAKDLRPDTASMRWRPDLLVGGAPCQPWSSAGSQRGLLDPRGQLIAHMLRLIGELLPRYVIFENVRGLVTARGATGTPGEVLRSIQDDLYSLGYISRVDTLNAADFGAPQRRVRLFLIATKDGVLPEFPRPTHSRMGAAAGLRPWVNLRTVLSDLDDDALEDVVRPTGARADALRALLPGTGLKTGGQIMANRPGGHWGYRQDAFLADLDLPARTIRAASTPDWVRPSGDADMRRLTWRECAALQGFPRDWAFVGRPASKFKQIGNAVQTDLATAVAGAVLDAWKSKSPVTNVMPAWPASLAARVSYTVAEERVNGHLRVRRKQSGAVIRPNED